MGWRYRKSIKIAPGIKLNFGKKSMGVSIGGKHGGVSINSRSGVTARTSIPGTGLSYTQKLGGKKKRSRRPASQPAVHSAASTAAVPKPPVVLRAWYIVLAVLLLLGGLANLPNNWEATICGVGAGGVMLFLTFKKRRELQQAAEAQEIEDETPPQETAQEQEKRDEVTIPSRLGDCLRVYFYPKAKIQPADGALEMARAMQASGNWALDAVATESGVALMYQGQKFADLLERYDMVKDWLARKDPMLIYLGNLGDSGNYVAIAFYRDEQKRLAYREQQVVRLTAYASEDHQDAILAREEGDKLDLEGDDPESGVEVCYGDTLGKLPKAAAKRYIEEGCAGVFLDHVDYDEEKDKYIPYVKIYW